MKPLNLTTRKSSYKKWILYLVIGIIIVFGMSVGMYQVVQSIVGTDFTQDTNKMFGDQHLKTSVALIELHKTRNGQYPNKLSDIKYTGKWDQLHLKSVDYRPGKDLQSYYIEVTRGWISKPVILKIPKGFWKGTGFDPILKSSNELKGH